MHRLHRLVDAALQPLDAGLDILGRVLRPRRQRPHLIGHDSKAAALLASARRLDGSIEREQISLLGNTTDHLENRSDAGGLVGQRADGLRRAFDILRQLAD